MRQINEVSPIYIRSCKSSSSYGENSIKEQLLKENPKLANESLKHRKALLKRVEKKLCIDSSYYLG
jgi:hypothetical protein